VPTVPFVVLVMTPYIEQIDPQLEAAAARLISSHPTVIDAMPTRKLRFAVDSPVEEDGFEPSVPLGDE
jgi:hypothetical protein